LGLVFFIPKETNAPTDEGAEEVGYAFMIDVVAVAPPSEDAEAAERLYDALSQGARTQVSEDSVARDIARFVGVQDVPDQGVSVEDLQIVSEEEAVLIVRLNYSSGSVLRNIHLIVENGVWKVDRISVFEEEVAEPQAFDKTGNIVKDNPGMEAGVWYLVYEEAGSPALNTMLQFSSLSVCVEGEESSTCEPDLLSQGDRVRVTGNETGGGAILVAGLEFID
jgi:hypothetical protein